MEKVSLKELLINWKYVWAKQKGKEKEERDYTKLSDSLSELETAIQKQLPQGGVLREYALLSKEWKEEIDDSLYEEVMRLYELCEETPYFDISEIEELFQLENTKKWDTETFLEKVMDVIVKAPVHIQKKDKLYNIQYHLFRLGKTEDVWYAYQYKKMFPKEILEELYEQLEKKDHTDPRLAWIVAWLSCC